MTKLMVCVKSCQRDKDLGFHDVIRGTWGKDAKALGIDVKFFLGSSFNNYVSDEVHLKCADDYNALPFKTREICMWASGKIADYIFLCDTDTYLAITPMMAWFEKMRIGKYDYAGKISKPIGKTFRYEHTGREGQQEVHECCHPWASGGYGYFLSKRALREVAWAFPTSECEDLWVGQVMGELYNKGEAKIVDHPANVYSWHHPQHGEVYDLPTLRDWMTQMYVEQK